MEEGPHPKPGAGSGNREKIPVDGEEIHRLHIGRTYTVLYDILEDGMGVLRRRITVYRRSIRPIWLLNRLPAP